MIRLPVREARPRRFAYTSQEHLLVHRCCAGAARVAPLAVDREGRGNRKARFLDAASIVDKLRRQGPTAGPGPPCHGKATLPARRHTKAHNFRQPHAPGVNIERVATQVSTEGRLCTAPVPGTATTMGAAKSVGTVERVETQTSTSPGSLPESCHSGATFLAALRPEHASLCLAAMFS